MITQTDAIRIMNGETVKGLTAVDTMPDSVVPVVRTKFGHHFALCPTPTERMTTVPVKLTRNGYEPVGEEYVAPEKEEPVTTKIEDKHPWKLFTKACNTWHEELTCAELAVALDEARQFDGKVLLLNIETGETRLFTPGRWETIRR